MFGRRDLKHSSLAVVAAGQCGYMQWSWQGLCWAPLTCCPSQFGSCRHLCFGCNSWLLGRVTLPPWLRFPIRVTIYHWLISVCWICLLWSVTEFSLTQSFCCLSLQPGKDSSIFIPFLWSQLWICFSLQREKWSAMEDSFCKMRREGKEVMRKGKPSCGQAEEVREKQWETAEMGGKGKQPTFPNSP